MADPRRILDANANRAREAVRVLEDAARFVLDDTKRAAAFKQLRHDLTAAAGRLGPLAAFRDTLGDVGTALSTAAEHRRASIAAVVEAASGRLAEALRSCEEYGKIVDPAVGAAFETLRYRAYTLCADLIDALRSPLQWRLCVLITEALCAHDWHAVAEAALDGGADCLQLREKELDDAALIDRAAELVEVADGRAAVIVNDRVDVAVAAGAAGVHLGTGDLPLGAARRVAPGLIIGASTHSLAEAKRAVAAGADYCGVGAVYAQNTKGRRPAGLGYVERFAARFQQTPHLAIGGITPDNIGPVVAAGARGVAVSAAVCGAAKPATAVRRLLRQIPKIR